MRTAAAAHIADRYDLPVVAAQVGYYRALRAMLDGNLAAAEDLYQRADAQIIALRMWQPGIRLSRGALGRWLGRFCVLLMHDRVAEITGELERACRALGAPVLLSEPYALALAASGRIAEAREAADHPRSEAARSRRAHGQAAHHLSNSNSSDGMVRQFGRLMGADMRRS